jgi:hypothetical protein
LRFFLLLAHPKNGVARSIKCSPTGILFWNLLFIKADSRVNYTERNCAEPEDTSNVAPRRHAVLQSLYKDDRQLNAARAAIERALCFGNVAA